VFALGGSHDGRAAVLFETLRRRVADLGLSPTTDVELTEDPDVTHIDTSRAPTSSVFFGATSRPSQIDDAVTELRRRGVFVLPVVPDTAKYNSYVPSSLSGINGLAANPADPQMESIAQRILEELRLTRDKRLVFISYRRDESTGVAEQLYRAFDERAFDVFLDTHSVRCGAEFQSVLWDRMADADLLVLIDTPRALTSRWVREELARAQALGLGVLQLVWPAHSRTAGTEFCEPRYLDLTDLEGPGGAATAAARLKEAVLQTIVSMAEALRARSLAARRARIVGEVWTRAASAGVRADIQPARCVDLQSSGGARYTVFPIVGHPDSIELFRCFEACGTPPRDGVLLYDPLGMLDPKRLHLGWLNKFLPLKAVPVTELDEWFKHL
jgi:hypothetical protein